MTLEDVGDTSNNLGDLQDIARVGCVEVQDRQEPGLIFRSSLLVMDAL